MPTSSCKAGQVGSPELVNELKAHVGHEVGPIAKPAHIEFVDTLPKTRSGQDHAEALEGTGHGFARGRHVDVGGVGPTP